MQSFQLFRNLAKDYSIKKNSRLIEGSYQKIYTVIVACGLGKNISIILEYRFFRQSESTSPIVVVLICVAIVLVLVILAIVGYGFTSNGRNQYINLYLYYFGKTSDYEKRWRYSVKF